MINAGRSFQILPHACFLTCALLESQPVLRSKAPPGDDPNSFAIFVARSSESMSATSMLSITIRQCPCGRPRRCWSVLLQLLLLHGRELRFSAVLVVVLLARVDMLLSLSLSRYRSSTLPDIHVMVLVAAASTLLLPSSALLVASSTQCLHCVVGSPVSDPCEGARTPCNLPCSRVGQNPVAEVVAVTGRTHVPLVLVLARVHAHRVSPRDTVWSWRRSSRNWSSPPAFPP